jgi:hypothetical protein
MMSSFLVSIISATDFAIAPLMMMTTMMMHTCTRAWGCGRAGERLRVSFSR